MAIAEVLHFGSPWSRQIRSINDNWLQSADKNRVCWVKSTETTVISSFHFCDKVDLQREQHRNKGRRKTTNPCSTAFCSFCKSDSLLYLSCSALLSKEVQSEWWDCKITTDRKNGAQLILSWERCSLKNCPWNSAGVHPRDELHLL